MPARWKTSYLGFAAILLAAAANAQGAAAGGRELTTLAQPAREAAATVDAFHDALGKNDQAIAAALLLDDAVIYESGRAERSKAEYASHHLPADTEFAAATTRTIKQRSGHTVGDLAWIATEATTTGAFKGRPVNSRSTETMILRREAGAWRIVHIHWSSANVK